MRLDYLIDNSALQRAHREVVNQRLKPLLLRRTIGICGFTALEALYSSRTPRDYDQRWHSYVRSYRWVEIDEAVIDRALQVQRMLASTSQHRTAKVVDLLIASVGELRQLTVLHYDKDFDKIAAITNQRCEWIAPPGVLA